MNWDVDNLIKRRKEQQAFGLHSGEPKICRCGRSIYPYPAVGGEARLGEEYIYDSLCTICFVQRSFQQRLENPETPLPKKSTCRFCWKPRKLIGAWCRTCRNNHQRMIIKAALSKLKNNETLTWEDEQTLELAPRWPIWKREFRNLKLPLLRK